MISEGETGMTMGQLFRSKVFWLLLVMMVCSGASEQAVSQWASAFAEQGLGISKAAGDLAGPMAFAICMGGARAVYGKMGEKWDLDRFMKGSLALCVASYLLISLSPWPVLSLVGCALCGMSVGILWPGTFSKASLVLRLGGTAMFALLALAGDLGCSAGPSLVGAVAEAAGGDLKVGILVAMVFPVALLLCLGKKIENT
jgi:fucose permease